MEIRKWALRILSSESLEDKLFQPDCLTDLEPGEPLIISEPARSHDLRLQKYDKKKEKLPPLHELKHRDQKIISLHRFAGHELLAVEIMAYTLLAFPNAPASFRKGVAHTLQEEQGHVKLYSSRIEALGGTFGSLPLFRHFWVQTKFLHSPLHYVSTMPLTLEMANLDFAPIYGKAFLQAGDEASADLMATILNDEIAHVRFGVQWLKKLKPRELSEWDAWSATLSSMMLTPRRAKGPHFNEASRKKAGVSLPWIQQLQEFSLAPSRLPPKEPAPPLLLPQDL